MPFTPCKKGYIPVVAIASAAGRGTVGGARQVKLMYACRYHDDARRRRVMKENGQFRNGEFDLSVLWERELAVAEQSSGNSSSSRRSSISVAVEDRSAAAADKNDTPNKNKSRITFEKATATRKK